MINLLLMVFYAVGITLFVMGDTTFFKITPCMYKTGINLFLIENSMLGLIQ